MQQRAFNQLDLSGGIQSTTSHNLKKKNEVVASKNAAYNIKIGSAVRRPGYEKVARTIEHGNDSLGATVYKYGQNNKIIVGINNSSDSLAEVRYLDFVDYWTPIFTAPANTRFQFLNDLDELYCAGSNDANTYLPLTNIDSTLTSSTTRNVYTAPACKYIAEFGGELWAINCYINGVYYPDRAYRSSPPLGAITFVQTDQSSILNSLRVDSVQYLKAGMTVDIYKAGTNAKIVSALPIVSVDKSNKRITFQPQSFSVSDNDEIWLTGTKGKLNRFWNTDYPTTEDADFIRVPSGKEARPEFTGWGKNNNRFFLFTKSSFMVSDGSNFNIISDTIGCVSHETIQNIGSWTLWLHTTGVWGYNINTGQLKLLSRAVDKFIKAINQNNLPYTSAGVVGRVYKLALGELLALDSETTSTSTSSTTVTTTSTSTSSTSTSSTSTSTTTAPTTTSTSSTSRSTSSTSSSTSSTSISSTSSSLSTSSTSSSTSTSSTTTTTAASTKNVIRLCYDFDMNSWWTEEHKREIRFQFNHTMHGYFKPYFTDDTGRLFRDETGLLDNEDSIPMEIETGRTNFGTNQLKNYLSVICDSENAQGVIVQYSIDGRQYETLGQITENVQTFGFPQGGQEIRGKDISYKFVHNDKGDAPELNGLTTYYSVAESVVYER